MNTPSPTSRLADELKPCPCCGSPAESDYRQPYCAFPDGRLGNAAAIYCVGCGLQISVCYRDVPEQSEEEVQEYVRGIWNRRAAESADECVWIEIEDDSGIYNTCKEGEEFHLTEGLELWPHCMWCGKKVVAQQAGEEGE